MTFVRGFDKEKSTPERLKQFPELLLQANDVINFKMAYDAECTLSWWQVWTWNEFSDLITTYNITEDQPASCYLLSSQKLKYQTVDDLQQMVDYQNRLTLKGAKLGSLCCLETLNITNGESHYITYSNFIQEYYNGTDNYISCYIYAQHLRYAGHLERCSMFKKEYPELTENQRYKLQCKQEKEGLYSEKELQAIDILKQIASEYQYSQALSYLGHHYWSYDIDQSLYYYFLDQQNIEKHYQTIIRNLRYADEDTLLRVLVRLPHEIFQSEERDYIPSSYRLIKKLADKELMEYRLSIDYAPDGKEYTSVENHWFHLVKNS